MAKEFSIINIRQVRNDVKNWKIKDAGEAIALAKNKVSILEYLLNDKDSEVKSNTLYLIEKLIKEKVLSPIEVENLLDKIIELTKHPYEKVSLDAIKLLKFILENVDISENSYTKISEALTNVIKEGRGVLSEYAAESLGVLGIKVKILVRKLVSALLSILKGSTKREVQSAAITALTEIAIKSNDKEISENIINELSELVKSEDEYLRERVLAAIERIISRHPQISEEAIKNLSNALMTLSKEKGSEKIDRIINTLKEKKEELLEEFSKYKVEELFDLEKHEIVAELAKRDENVLDAVIDLLSSEDYIKRTDALWVLSKIVDNLGPSKAYSILPSLGSFVKSKNPWVRDTATKILATIYFLYPGTKNYILSLLDSLVKSPKKEDLEAGLKIVEEMSKNPEAIDLFKAVLILTLKRLQENEVRLPILKFYARMSDKFLVLDEDVLEVMFNALNSIYERATDEERLIITQLLDLIATLKTKKQEAKESLQ